MSDNANIDFTDMQGLLRFGHGHLAAARFLLLRIADVTAARRWLLAAPVSTAEKTRPVPGNALQVAFTAPGLAALGLKQSVLDGFSQAFSAGMAGEVNRSRRLGDTGQNSPANWTWGGTEDRLPHVLIMLYATPEGIDSWQAKLSDDAFTAGFSECAAPLESTRTGPEEPFGFVDGISQPSIDWQQQLSTDVHQRDRYSNRLALGELVLGYTNEYGLYTDRPLIDPAADDHANVLPQALDLPAMRDLGRNGSYLVLRQLEQDVEGFWKTVDQAAGGGEEAREALAAAMVGRWRSGAPLVAPSEKAIEGIEPDSAAEPANHFNYDSDPLGHGCPIGAHIRRSNPRTGDFPPGVDGMLSRLVRMLGFGQQHPRDDLVASSRFHRLLRRGRVYGPVLSPERAIQSQLEKAERGLKFVCLGASLSRQFEFVQNAWNMSSKFAGLPTEADPLLGNREALADGTPTDRFTRPQPGAPAVRIEGLPQFVTVRGGAYFFLPGIRALRYIAGADDGQGA